MDEIQIKTKEEIEILKEGGAKLAELLEELSSEAKPEVTTAELDEKAHQLFKRSGGKPAFFKHRPEGAPRPFPGAVCVSVNEEVVHGIPNEYTRFLHEGDIVGIDAGLEYRGLFTDTAVTVAIGSIDENAENLMKATRRALNAGIRAAVPGVSVVDIGRVIEESVDRRKYGIVKVLGGHGVGRAVHEPPFIPNYEDKNFDARLEEGMVVAIEPMLTEGSDRVYVDRDGWTFKTVDDSRSAHFEHTIAITKDGPLIITQK